jgi:hypothetical protein
MVEGHFDLPREPGAAVQHARDAGDTRAEALVAGLLAEVDAILRDANDAAVAYVQREAGYVRTGSHVARVEGRGVRAVPRGRPGRRVVLPAHLA